jgi:hypothetical protein
MNLAVAAISRIARPRMIAKRRPDLTLQAGTQDPIIKVGHSATARNRPGSRGLSRPGGHMLTNAQIAILCDIGQPLSFTQDKQREADRLVAAGYAEKRGASYRLTAKGQKLLADRGAGLNES